MKFDFTVKLVDLIGHNERGRDDIECFLAFVALHSLYVLVQAVFPREFTRAWEMVHFLVLLKAAKRVALQITPAPNQIKLRTILMYL